MNHSSPVELSASLQPVLLVDERLLVVQDNAGIYDSQEKPTRANGKVYLTSHRVIYVDSKQPESNSVALELKRVKGLEYMTGFLKSSRKVVLHFSVNNSAARKPTPTWSCPNCASSNTIQLKSCSFCGEKAPDSPLASPTLQNSLQDDTNKTIERPCPNCTYMNRVTLLRCEMCATELPHGDDDSAQDFGGDYVRIGFKKGGSTQFYDKLQAAMSLKVWEQKNLDRIHG